MVFALGVAGLFTGSLDGWQQQGHQSANDRNDNQQLDKRKTVEARWSAKQRPPDAHEVGRWSPIRPRGF
jgi:hypothetical protein